MTVKNPSRNMQPSASKGKDDIMKIDISAKSKILMSILTTLSKNKHMIYLQSLMATEEQPVQNTFSKTFQSYFQDPKYFNPIPNSLSKKLFKNANNVLSILLRPKKLKKQVDPAQLYASLLLRRLLQLIQEIVVP